MYDFRPGARFAVMRAALAGQNAKGWLRRPRAALALFETSLPSLDRIKREKGVWWMPWQQEAMKDVILCDKPWGAENEL